MIFSVIKPIAFYLLAITDLWRPYNRIRSAALNLRMKWARR